MGHKFLNIGSGEDYINGWVNLDSNRSLKADKYHDLNKFPWPFKDNEFDKVLASYVLEYLDDVTKAMIEIYRITKPNGIVYISVPHISNPFKWMELGHKHCFSYLSFGEWHNNKELYPLFEMLKKKIGVPKDIAKALNLKLNENISKEVTIIVETHQAKIPIPGIMRQSLNLKKGQKCKLVLDGKKKELTCKF